MIALWLPGTPCVINYCCEGGLALFRSSAKVVPADGCPAAFGAV